MRINFSKTLLAIALMAVILNGCTKSDLSKPPGDAVATDAIVTPIHNYGVLEPVFAQYANAPMYDANKFIKSVTTESTTTSYPSVLSLVSPGIRDQGQIGSCTAFCGTEAYEILYYYAYGAFPTVLSPAYLYYTERVKILGQRITADGGAYMIDIPQALQKYGLCLESLYPYPTSDKSTAYKTAPTASAVSNALGYEIGQKTTSYALINTGDTTAVKNLLRNNIPVMMGLNVYDNAKYQYFEGLNTTNYTYNPLTSTGALAKGVQLLGGHATPIIGYDDTKQAFLVQNSWGTAWGLNGFYYMPYSVFKSTKIVPQGGVFYATLN